MHISYVTNISVKEDYRKSRQKQKQKHLLKVLGELQSSEEIQVRIWGGTSLEEWVQVWGLLSQGVIADSGDGSWETSRDEAQWTIRVLTGYALGVKVYPVIGPCRHYSSGLQPPEGLTWQHQGLAKTWSDRNFQAWLMGLQIGSLNLENTFALSTKVEDMYSLGAFNSIPR